MKVAIDYGTGKRPLHTMTTPQIKQAVAVMDCIGRLIPQEGVDYDVEIVFKDGNPYSVSMGVIALTDKGEWWKKYVLEMIKKYPPTIENPPEAIQEGVPDEKIVP